MSLYRWRIIAAAFLAAALLAGCGTMPLRLAYNSGPRLLYWWLDGYADLGDVQSTAVRDAIGGWFRWHRTTQLPRYAEALARVKASADAPMTGPQLCAMWQDVREFGEQSLEHGMPAIAAFVRTLTPQQLHNIERRFEKGNREFREEHLQPDPAQRQRAAHKRARDRAEMLYGTLQPQQREWLVLASARSPFNPEAWYAERLRRQEDILRTLRSVVVDEPGMPAERVQATMSALTGRLLESPREEHRRYQERLTAYNCSLVAELHNSATPEQRQHARRRLGAWIEDLRELSGQTAG